MRVRGRELSQQCIRAACFVTYSAVAVTRDHVFIPFGPAFASEDDAWRWLHFDACDQPIPAHHYIEVFPTALFAQLR